MMDEQLSIEVENLTKSYGRIQAVRNVSFRVRKGEIVGFLGPNGAGKSTTMRILCGLVKPQSGKARICGIPVARNPDAVKRCIGYMPENNPLPEHMRVCEYLRFRAKLKEVPRRRRRERINEVLELCDLHHKANRKIIGSLSKGFRQRVGVADAILGEPAVAILDEPTIGLDPHQVLAVRRLINNLRGSMSIILSSHILAEVELSCDRVLILNQGRIVAEGTPVDLRREFIKDQQYWVRARGDHDALLGALKNGDPTITHSAPIPDEGGDGVFSVTLTLTGHDDQSERLVALICGISGIHLLGFQRRKASLEDIFLAATRRSWDRIEPVIGGTVGTESSTEG